MYALTALFAVSGVHGAIGQEADIGGVTAELSVSESLQYSDSRGGERLAAVTRLGFGIVSRTRSQALAFDVNSGLDYTISGSNALDQDDSDFFEPRASLSYTHTSRSAEIAASASYRREEVFGFLSEQGFITIELVPATGLREDFDADAAFVFGKGAPFGGTLSYGLRDRSYSEEFVGTIFDNRRQTLSADLNFRLTGRITANLLLRRSLYEAEDAVETERTDDRIAVGVDLQISPVLTASAALDYDRRETEQLTGTTITEGAGIDLSANLTRPNGALTAALSNSVTPSGRRTTLRFGRGYELREDATFSFSLGATQTDDLPIAPVLDLSFERNLERGSVLVSLSQEAETDINDRQVVSTRATARIQRPINTRQSFDTSFSLANTNVLDEDVDADRTRADLRLNYSYDLGARWNLNIGASHTRFLGDDIEDDSRSTVFAGVSRTFAFRP